MEPQLTDQELSELYARRAAQITCIQNCTDLGYTGLRKKAKKRATEISDEIYNEEYSRYIEGITLLSRGVSESEFNPINRPANIATRLTKILIEEDMELINGFSVSLTGHN